jgi:hypothetical protein
MDPLSRRLILLFWLSACATDPTDNKSASAPDNEQAEALFLLTRGSMDLRGVRPSLEEIATVQADPLALDGLLERYLADPRFGDRYAELMGGVWLTPVTESDHTQATYPVDNELQIIQSMGEEPLKILAWIAANDLPYTELVTGDWTVVDAHLAALYPTDYPEGSSGWRQVHYTDGRPAAGVLSTNGLWWRYDSTQANANRGRANAVSRILTCHDYLEVQITGDRQLNLLDEAAVAAALQSDPACVECHASLDPAAAYFWGFYNHFNFSPSEQSHYHAERETLWEDTTGVGPAWQGEPGQTLTDLGLQLARDPRFIECVVERSLEQFLSRPARLEDQEALTRHREAFLAGGLTIRTLVASILRDPAWRAAPGTGGPRASGTRLVSAGQLASSIEDLTGFRFRAEDLDVFGADLYGMRSLAGGVGPSWDTEAALEPTATAVLVQQRLAEAAAYHVVKEDFANPAGARLITRSDIADRADGYGSDRMRAQMQTLYLRFFAMPVETDGPEVEALMALWADAFDLTADPALAWTAVVTALLRDPALLFY